MTWSRRSRPIAERFWAKVDKRGPDECWLWTASITNGYGALGIGPERPGRYVPAHRFSWELHHGPIATGLYVCHRCDVRACVNPNHLFLGTCADNLHDMLAEGRQNNQRKTHCKRGHAFSAENTRHAPDGARYCRACDRERSARERRAISTQGRGL